MERVKALVSKLQEQLNQQADPASMLQTVQLLEAELTGKLAPVINRTVNTKVAVVMPSPHRPAEPVKAMPTAGMQVLDGAQTSAMIAGDAVAVEVPPAQKQQDWLHNLMQQIPTLAHQKEIREVNEVMNNQQGTSLNDKLKPASVELAEALTREQVRDLKKAIGINDRFVFVNELFRGDEVMYERSIKTINSFNILQEAEFWIERELKLKLAWDDSKDAVRHFLQLVRRRFS
jgi:hypothetical protein